ncbi:hypothetical protein MKQ70_13950 [Chitinophaga sedimenti]|uniref:hypothetical protein n=1 Tax=Chitinophaga sedimenti TaxID=2033606 RepID=UPI002006C205|nr:hypothetical protein [Chitinophaga sedimenti]MCK7556062.1 hypothetical protein [Chitinophaga sedimenti]
MTASTTITLSYRKIIDAQSDKPWEKMVFEDSFTEFRMQAQSFDPLKQHRTFAELVQQVHGAAALHFLVSASVTGYLRQLGGRVPDVTDNLGKLFLRFENFRFEIIQSDRATIQQHRVAINFYSRPLYWLDTIHDYLLLSDPESAPTGDDSVPAILYRLSPFVSIHAIKKVLHEK